MRLPEGRLIWNETGDRAHLFDVIIQHQNTMSVKFRVTSCEDFIDHTPVHVGKPTLEAVVEDAEAFVIEAE